MPRLMIIDLVWMRRETPTYPSWLRSKPLHCTERRDPSRTHLVLLTIFTRFRSGDAEPDSRDNVVGRFLWEQDSLQGQERR
jgi:hypothetical protein